MKNITAVLISFLRVGYTKACILSLKKEYPDIKIIVADNAGEQTLMREFCDSHNVRYEPMPYDSGVCYARNRLVEMVDTEFVLVGDDDFYYTSESMVDSMMYFLENHQEFDLIGGRVSQNEVIHNYQGTFEQFDDHIKITPMPLGRFDFGPDELAYHKADLTFNYFVGRTEKIRNVPWDENIKVAYEHLTWFVDFKNAGGNVAFSPDPVVIHKPRFIEPQQSSEYAEYRNRVSDREYFFKRFGIDYTIQMNGKKDFGPSYISKINNTTINFIKDVDFCITTFKRPQALKKLLLSISKFYPMANVFVADQNEIFDRGFYKNLREEVRRSGLIKRLSVDKLPFDCGLSFARNHLVKNTPNKYKLILDDDFEFTRNTDISKMVILLDSNKNIGIVGGSVDQLGEKLNFEFNLEIKDGAILQIPDKNGWRNYQNIVSRKTGCVLNFALMRSDLFNYISWDNNLKITEHTDFYLRMREVPYQIVYCPSVVVSHPPYEKSGDYKQFRQRDEFQVRLLKKWGVSKMKYLNGQVVELMPNGALKRYKENV